ncbi:MAG TPA: ATP-binding cassette domain-containing protein [Jiangellales bacterium]|nr:ATP-binding cassette domain-containing protein [Jiangellales bacterium]
MTAASDLAVETSRLTKRFGRQAAVDGIDLAVPTGAVYGFLGPNGSGKTTTIRVLLGLAAATEGEVTVLGHPIPGAARSVLPRVGALVEGPAFYPFLSGAANLARFDAADPGSDAATRAARIESALERVGLVAAARRKAKTYSLGMKQRLGIAVALLRPRDLLVLDEPTNGLDPQGTREVRALVRSLAAEGSTVLVSSHLLAEVEQICTHVGVMSRGRLVAQGTLEEFRGAESPRFVVRTPDPGDAVTVLAGLGLTAGVAGDVVTAELDGVAVARSAAPTSAAPPLPRATPAAEDVVAALVAAGVRVRGFAIERPSLEERFVALTGEGFEVPR